METAENILLGRKELKALWVEEFFHILQKREQRLRQFAIFRANYFEKYEVSL